MIRKLMFAALVIAGGLSLVNVIFNRARWLSAFAFALVALSALLGGHKVEVNPNFPDNTPYIGLDWFILDLLGSSLIFIFIEKLFALRRDQPVFRPELADRLSPFHRQPHDRGFCAAGHQPHGAQILWLGQP